MGKEVGSTCANRELIGVRSKNRFKQPSAYYEDKAKPAKQNKNLRCHL